MRILILSLFFIAVSGLYGQKSWQHYYDRIPAWPGVIDQAVVDTFNARLRLLNDELDLLSDGQQEGIDEGFEGMSMEEAMKLAEKYQKNVATMDPQKIDRMSRETEEMTHSLNKGVELDREFEAALKEFSDAYFLEKGKIEDQYPCDMGLESSSNRCSERSAALQIMGDKFSSKYFIGTAVGIRKAAGRIEDYLFKENLPSALKKENDEYQMMGMDPPVVSATAIEVVRSYVQVLMRCGEKMEWVAGIRAKENLFYYPGN